MSRTVKKIVLVLIIIILLPGLFFTVYEINQIKDSEKVLENIYSNQLEAILFSVNQYSQDYGLSWKSSINSILVSDLPGSPGIRTKIDSFLNINTAIAAVIFTDSVKSNKTIVIEGRDSLHKVTAEDAKFLLSSNSRQIKKLFGYKKAGYFKIDPLNQNLNDTSSALAFFTTDPKKQNNLCIIVLNPERFIQNVLGPRITSVSQNELIITCVEKNTDRVIFSTGNNNNREITNRKALWLIPGYEVGILPRNWTIESILDERTNTSIILVIILTAILLIGVFIVFRNIRREVELAQIKSDFVSNVSHELRTPLALISMFSETLEMGRVRSEEKKQEYYTIISKEALRLSRIVNKILSFSKIEAGKREYHFSYVNINKSVEDIFNTYQFHLQNSGFKFCLNNEEDIPDVKADSEAVCEALVNLIDNAVKYSGDVKEINIITGADKNSVFIEVTDKGVGISDENQKKIFDKFFRVSEGLVHNTKGTGLGLTLVKHIMDAHHGQITVKSKPGEGSSFRLVFPLYIK